MCLTLPTIMELAWERFASSTSLNTRGMVEQALHPFINKSSVFPSPQKRCAYQTKVLNIASLFVGTTKCVQDLNNNTRIYSDVTHRFLGFLIIFSGTCSSLLMSLPLALDLNILEVERSSFSPNRYQDGCLLVPVL